MRISTIEEDINKEKNLLLELRMQRKQIEGDVQLLANRVHLLESEEKKALKKIEETRKKAKDVLETKRRNFEQNKMRMLVNFTSARIKKLKDWENIHQYWAFKF